MKVNKLYMVKVELYQNRERLALYETRIYRNFRCIIGDIVNGSPELFDNVPDEYTPKDYNQMFLMYGSEEENGTPDDFEIRYKFGDKQLIVYIGKIMIEDVDFIRVRR